MEIKILKKIKQAQKKIKGEIKKTPLIFLNDFNFRRNLKIYLKPECLQTTGSFKIRGVLNKLSSLTEKEKKNGVVAFSAGSHAISLAYVSSLFKIPCCVVVPKTTSKNKLNLMKKYGAKIVFAEGNDIFKKCLSIVDKENMTLVHPFDDPLIIAGQGTIGLEIIKELSDVDVVLVPIGGGGLISGIAAAIKTEKPSVKIVGVEPIGADSMYKSIKGNQIVKLEKTETIAKSLAAPCVGKNTFKYAKKYVDEYVLVSDQEIKKTLALITQKINLKIEPSGVASLAAVIFKKVKIKPNSKIVCVLTGGNISDNNLNLLIRNGK